jgi:phosphohistidine phosphatase
VKKIILVRHAKSSWDSGARSDIERPLNNRGKKDAPFMAAKLKEIVGEIDGSIKSPSRRTTQTSKPFHEIFEISAENDLTDQNLYHGTTDDILDAIRGLPESWNSVLLFAHNPGMTYTAHYFGGSEIFNVPTCGILIVESESNDWALVNNDNSKIKSFEYPKKYHN